MSVPWRPGNRCKCNPSDGYHQYNCPISQKMRAELIEAGKIRTPPDPTKRAKVIGGVSWD